MFKSVLQKYIKKDLHFSVIIIIYIKLHRNIYINKWSCSEENQSILKVNISPELGGRITT